MEWSIPVTRKYRQMLWSALTRKMQSQWPRTCHNYIYNFNVIKWCDNAKLEFREFSHSTEAGEVTYGVLYQSNVSEQDQELKEEFYRNIFRRIAAKTGAASGGPKDWTFFCWIPLRKYRPTSSAMEGTDMMYHRKRQNQKGKKVFYLPSFPEHSLRKKFQTMK